MGLGTHVVLETGEGSYCDEVLLNQATNFLNAYLGVSIYRTQRLSTRGLAVEVPAVEVLGAVWN